MADKLPRKKNDLPRKENGEINPVKHSEELLKQFDQQFKKIGTLEMKNNKIVCLLDNKDFESDNKDSGSGGVIYLLIVDERIFKIGCSEGGIKGAVDCFNKGDSKGVTDQFVFMSMRNLKKADVYAYKSQKPDDKKKNIIEKKNLQNRNLYHKDLYKQDNSI